MHGEWLGLRGLMLMKYAEGFRNICLEWRRQLVMELVGWDCFWLGDMLMFQFES
jgi:hypothetical protein